MQAKGRPRFMKFWRGGGIWPRAACLNCKVDSFNSKLLKGLPFVAGYGLQVLISIRRKKSIFLSIISSCLVLQCPHKIWQLQNPPTNQGLTRLIIVMLHFFFTFHWKHFLWTSFTPEVLQRWLHPFKQFSSKQLWELLPRHGGQWIQVQCEIYMHFISLLWKHLEC